MTVVNHTNEEFEVHTCDLCGEMSVNVERLSMSGFFVCPGCLREQGLAPRTERAPRPSSGIRGLARLPAAKRRQAVEVRPEILDGIFTNIKFQVFPMCGGEPLKRVDNLEAAMEYCRDHNLVPYAPNGDLL
jgi:hypothetical protein